ncbi:TPA: LPXTG cell wall anchor domain-containing protein [Streptococcus equi subsp. zooepidemicus]|nr:LPXTG cell wall anchor domain-containing protein [Streptococcus equi subsp. zooepidemicus]HEL1088964.1 LPXTG cell wall anchor domain-containing protein [Streptococcus equi subsp. zooepidemicus]
MKSCKSTLRKAAMAAMLAGAITTTGGVKAEESLLSTKLLKNFTNQNRNADDAFDVLTKLLRDLTADEIDTLLIELFVDENVSNYTTLINSIGKAQDLDSGMSSFLGALMGNLGERAKSEELLRVDKTELEAKLQGALQISEDLANKLLAAQAEAERLSQAVDSLGRLTESAKRELTEKLAEIDQLTQDKAKAASDLETANANITTLQEELAGVKADVDKLSEEKAAADQALAEANARVSNLEQEVAAANNRVADLEAQLAEKTAELDMVKADKAELEAKVKELQSLLEQKDHNNADLQAEIKRLKQELADKFKDLSQPRAKTPQASNSVAKQKASRPAAKPAGQLPSTGEDAANPFFTAAAVAIMTGAGLVTVMPKRQKN